MEKPQARDQARLTPTPRRCRAKGRRGDGQWPSGHSRPPGPLPRGARERRRAHGGAAVPRPESPGAPEPGSPGAAGPSPRGPGAPAPALPSHPTPRREQGRRGTWAPERRPQTGSRPGWEARGEIPCGHRGRRRQGEAPAGRPGGRVPNRTTPGAGAVRVRCGCGARPRASQAPRRR